MRWDLFCRVIDNLGDAGVCWRLAADLAGRGHRVRLVIDDTAPLAHIAPAGAPRVEALPWRDELQWSADVDVVVEAFGCDPPAPYVGQMARAERPPCWINLEYLSAESHARRSHGLPSPQLSGPGQGLTKWFFQPGFTPEDGGLIREPGLLDAHAAFDRDAWLGALGCRRRAGERVSVLFCYGHPGVADWLAALAEQPTLLLVPQGPAQDAVRRALAAGHQRDALRAVLLDWMPQDQFDRVLWSSDLSVVRGEDSLVRALWAGAPFAWQLYPQRNGVHRRKLQAFLERWQADSPGLPQGVAETLAWWNAEADAAGPVPQAPALEAWRVALASWRHRLIGQSDLATRLVGFATAKR